MPKRNGYFTEFIVAEKPSILARSDHRRCSHYIEISHSNVFGPDLPAARKTDIGNCFDSGVDVNGHNAFKGSQLSSDDFLHQFLDSRGSQTI